MTSPPASLSRRPRRRATPTIAKGAALLALLAANAAWAQTGDPEAGAIKAAQCSGCHGIPGWRNAYPAYRVPKLGGQHAAYLISALEAYKNGTRAHSTMQAIAAGLSEQDMADLAAFFSAEQ